jgi:hypothetical protein
MRRLGRAVPYSAAGALLCLGTALFLLAAFVPTARAAGEGSVVVYDEARDYSRIVQHQLFAEDGAQINGQVVPGQLSVSAMTSAGDSVGLHFAAPAGKALTKGVHVDAERAGSSADQQSTMVIDGTGGSFCDAVDGGFEIRDFAFEPDGTLTRLWLIFETRCAETPRSMFGEIRYGMPPAASALLAMPSAVRWPAADLGRSGRSVPVTVRSLSSVRIAGASLVGEYPADFRVNGDQCSGKTLSAGQTCAIAVDFHPAASGRRTATLRIADANGKVLAVPLQGFTYGGRTRVALNSDAGDFAGAGKRYAYTPANADIDVLPGENTWAGFRVAGPTGVPWAGDFVAPVGQTLVAGRYAGAGPPGTPSQPGLAVYGGFCNTVTGEFTVSGPSFGFAHWRRLGVGFEQHCEGAAPALRGSFEYRVGDITAPAPWMRAGPVTSLASPSPTVYRLPGTPSRVKPTGWCSGARFARATTRYGSSRADRIRGTSRDEIILAGRGNDRVAGGGGRDCIDGGSGRDSLRGDSGADHIAGGAGNDRLNGGKGRDFLDCGPGRRDVARITRGDRTRGCERVLGKRRKTRARRRK